ncbi:hypothetical protein [Hyphococcus sp.]|uniref:hypothetical protein n=1 Tax=Hyphococcus sp. TaxID=2038636 RepID=UPI0020838C0B|nr:MAG: hypothetical protein DHS20C04_19770 [Marinicaulis sp.]
MDENELEDLERELPGLARLSRFARSLDRIPWFANIGEKLTLGARAAAEDYCSGLGFPDAEIAMLMDWEDAASVAESLDWQSQAWEAEESLRAELTGRALEILSEDALRIGMALIAEKVADPAKEAVEELSYLSDLDDEQIKTLCVGAAVQAANGAALALIAAEDSDFDAENHPFAAKFRLFEFGRWPVSITGSSFNLF